MTQLLKNKKGTTLVELVVCMVLLSLFVVVVAIDFFSEYLRKKLS